MGSDISPGRRSAANTWYEGAEQCQEAVRGLQEREEKGRQICLHHLQQEPKAQAKVGTYECAVLLGHHLINHRQG